MTCACMGKTAPRAVITIMLLVTGITFERVPEAGKTWLRPKKAKPAKAGDAKPRG